jgi:hypothetical protein
MGREKTMAEFTWIGDRTILYKGRVIELASHDGWEAVNAMKQVDEAIDMEGEKNWRKQIEDEVNVAVKKSEDDQTGIEKALESIAIDMHKQVRLMQELIMTLEKMRKGQK